ncbi:hypothetical protein C8F04DRAFT_1043062 [Mycena alexandri]|uniref:Zn(2)-C6 fungal-type domain-containing protein n=1 Tax=Mycena alexandri TaxID=1745969 RepID=A0AAD6X2J3_9AGAR|nr:hypothetical protein C8F04DRAFT_1043062 [Mycena alexandri]
MRSCPPRSPFAPLQSSMAVRHQGSLYSLSPGVANISSDRNAYHSSSLYGASFGGNIPYRYHTHATSAEGHQELSLDYNYAESPTEGLASSQSLEGGAIRQPTLPRLQIPTRPAVESPSPRDVSATFHSAIAPQAPTFHPPPFRGPLSAPDASEDFRYHQLYEDPSRAASMQVASIAGGSQPTRAQGEGRSLSPPVRVPRRKTTSAVIACRQCRTRKIRCDSTRPHCSNCSRRADQCEYDPAPKRRGPDKRPGTRQRRPKKRADDVEGEEEPRRKSARMIALPSPLPISSPESASPPRTHPQPASSTQPPSSEISAASYGTTPASSSYAYEVTPYARSAGGYDLGQPSTSYIEHPKFPSIPSTAVQASQQGWWDAFLRSYRLRDIATELNFLFTQSAISLSFVNVRFLMKTLWDPTKYLTLQPAFILASMALAVLIQSSEAERGASGRERAAFLRHSAQDALERTWREGVWLDASLAEAALIITQYEASAHPEYSPDRLARAFAFMDEIIAALGLTAVDAGSADVCRYASGAAPVVPAPPDLRCACIPPGAPPPDRDSVWSSALPWDPSWGEREIRDEECRRLCWSALSLATSFRTECMALARTDECLGLRLCDPANVRRCGRGQGQDGGGDAGAAHPKNAIWALYCRSMLLANFCSNVVARETETRDERESQAEALHESWQEAQGIQDALDGHVCNLHTAIAYLCRENVPLYRSSLIFCSLQGISTGPRPGPLFNRRQAEEWIYYQAEVVKRVTMSIQYVSDPRGQQLTQRPFAVTWFYHQLAICLLLWEHDAALVDVLELAKSFLVPLDVMNALWPCDLIQLQCTALRKRLAAHCRSAGREPPPPMNYSLPVVRRNS